MDKLLKINYYVTKIETAVLVIAIWSIAVVLVMNVVGRTFFSHSFSWAEETGTIFMVYVTFIGASYCTSTGQHIHMSALFDLLPKQGKKITLLVVDLLTGIFLLALAYIGFQYIAGLFESGRTTPALLIPMYIPYSTVPIAFLIAAMKYFLLFVLTLKDIGPNGEIHTYLVEPDVEEAFSEEAYVVEKGGEAA